MTVHYSAILHFIVTYINRYVRTFLTCVHMGVLPMYIHTYVHAYMPTILPTYLPTYIARTYDLHTYTHTHIHTYTYRHPHIHIYTHRHGQIRTYIVYDIYSNPTYTDILQISRFLISVLEANTFLP